MSAPVWLELFLIGTSILFFTGWTRSRQKAADYGTDLMTLIIKKDLDSRDLRRSLRHKEIRQKIEQNYEIDAWKGESQ